MKMNWFDWVTYVLLVVGGLNWGLVGFFDWNLVTTIFGFGTLTSIVYDAVGLSTLWVIYRMAKM